MAFTDEPSIFWDGHFGVRCEDVVVCAEGGGRVLNAYPKESVVNDVPGGSLTVPAASRDELPEKRDRSRLLVAL